MAPVVLAVLGGVMDDDHCRAGGVRNAVAGGGQAGHVTAVFLRAAAALV
jgi:hypothetical protein